MKVLFWAERIWPEIGGIETFARQLLPEMRKRGHTITVISSGTITAKSGMDPELGITIWRFPFAEAFKNNDLRLVKTITQQVNQIVRTVKPDLIHLNTLITSSFFFLRIHKEIRPPTLLTLHAKLAGPEYAHNLQKLVLNNIDYIVGVSQATLDRCLQVAPSFTERSTVIYNGRYLPSIKPQALPFDIPTLLCLGRLSEEKGFDIALEAFAIVRHHIPKARLIIAGDGDERASLERQARDLAINDSITFTGQIHPDQVPDLMNQSTIVLMPSRHDQFPLVAIEAAQMARPVIASCVGGLNESVIHKQTGLLVMPKDCQELAVSIINLIENPEIAVRYSMAARERAINEFGITQFIDSYDRIYQKVAGNHLNTLSDISPKLLSA